MPRQRPVRRGTALHPLDPCPLFVTGGLGPYGVLLGEPPVGVLKHGLFVIRQPTAREGSEAQPLDGGPIDWFGFGSNGVAVFNQCTFRNQEQ